MFGVGSMEMMILGSMLLGTLIGGTIVVYVLLNRPKK